MMFLKLGIIAAVAYAQKNTTACDLGGITGSWNWHDEDEQTVGPVKLLSGYDLMAVQTHLINGGDVAVDTDISLRIQRDDSKHRSYVKYIRKESDTADVETFQLMGGYADHTNIELLNGGSQIKCTGNKNGHHQCKSLPQGVAVDVVLVEVYMAPRSGSAHRNQWFRNKFTFAGTRYNVLKAGCASPFCHPLPRVGGRRCGNQLSPPVRTDLSVKECKAACAANIHCAYAVTGKNWCQNCWWDAYPYKPTPTDHDAKLMHIKTAYMKPRSNRLRKVGCPDTYLATTMAVHEGTCEDRGLARIWDQVQCKEAAAAHGYEITRETGIVKVTEGTCESNGYVTIYDRDDCIDGAADHGHTITWGPHGGYTDVVRGCSVRMNTQLFLNPDGKCIAGSCECTKVQPCFCQRKYDDITDGCTVEMSKQLFFNAIRGTCEKGMEGCESTHWQPSLCKARGLDCGASACAYYYHSRVNYQTEKNRAVLGAPLKTTPLTELKTISNYGKNYVVKVEAWIKAPATGDFVFYTNSAEDSVVYVSPNPSISPDTPSTTWLGQYVKVVEQAAGEGRVEGTTAVHFEAGRYYFLVGWMHDGNNRDFFEIGFKGPGVDEYIIGGDHIEAPTGLGYQFIRKGHCSEGWQGNTEEDTLDDCAMRCQDDLNCRYIAYHAESQICAIYSESCPDDGLHLDYHVYKLYRHSGCYLEYCNAHPDLMDAFCGGTECTAQAHFDSCKRHWETYREINLPSRIYNPEICKAIPDAGCYLEYCNAHQDLKDAFCGGAECTTRAHFFMCKSHWVTHREDNLQTRSYNPVLCEAIQGRRRVAGDNTAPAPSLAPTAAHPAPAPSLAPTAAHPKH